ncbi:MAG: hypothetical protein FJX39_07015 [Alphaproteobacteria bacterium]|nr:hypothetical protein [Alphaproteobacteria bacterium]
MLELLTTTGVVYALWILSLALHEAIFGESPELPIWFRRDEDGEDHRPKAPGPRPAPRHEPEVERANIRARALAISH